MGDFPLACSWKTMQDHLGMVSTHSKIEDGLWFGDVGGLPHYYIHYLLFFDFLSFIFCSWFEMHWTDVAGHATGTPTLPKAPLESGGNASPRWRASSLHQHLHAILIETGWNCWFAFAPWGSRWSCWFDLYDCRFRMFWGSCFNLGIWFYCIE